ncbi:uncharacterized protein HMPREF1120_02339 [Exophiala dermatitidis NIH/UT8656]|uniref:Uncharacterized protein n=1 Tax=Exophiala dermatitidis (strain ATCC 34100 / CBS 525.76 / NIH/UT8656) TaxID=858893 RepID=H6BSA9_EXODN|nr:uncharacterized protein HMPREF1120_02339 [Exophiala dermatitidis NIH/UT8656]EHY54164.1 hypothetical protein HMPREF1120_02339 [Exophiala dermatitidis NIH/UT8656]
MAQVSQGSKGTQYLRVTHWDFLSRDDITTIVHCAQPPLFFLSCQTYTRLESPLIPSSQVKQTTNRTIAVPVYYTRDFLFHYPPSCPISPKASGTYSPRSPRSSEGSLPPSLVSSGPPSIPSLACSKVSLIWPRVRLASS